MNTNTNILDDIDDREDMDEDELLRQQQNTWTMCIEHDGGGARRDVHPPPPRLIPLSSTSKEGIEASEIRMKMMKYEADTKPFSPPISQRNNGTIGVAVQSVSKSVGTQTTTDVQDQRRFTRVSGKRQETIARTSRTVEREKENQQQRGKSVASRRCQRRRFRSKTETKSGYAFQASRITTGSVQRAVEREREIYI